MKPSLNIRRLKKDLTRRASPARAKILAGFFKTGKGEYGQGDKFYGVRVPATRSIAKKYVKTLTLSGIDFLLRRGWHEERLCALLILVDKFKQGSGAERKKIFDFYLRHSRFVNNWDLVDLSARHIVGAYLWGKSKNILFDLASSKNLWQRRIAAIATFYDIANEDPRPTFKIADMLLQDKHDLIHKAVGWMLREAGKRCGEKILEDFLKPRYKKMPRTMLRYAIERFPEKKRRLYLAGRI